MARSARPRTRAGSSSSTAELMAEYSPPIPVPVRKRNRAKGANPQEMAVSAVAVVYTPRVTRKSFLRPRASVRRPKKRAPRIAPSRYALAARPTWLSDRCRVEGSVNTVAMDPTRVTSSPSSAQVIPSATTTRRCHGDQGSRSSRPGMSVSVQVPRASWVSLTASSVQPLSLPPLERCARRCRRAETYAHTWTLARVRPRPRVGRLRPAPPDGCCRVEGHRSGRQNDRRLSHLGLVGPACRERSRAIRDERVSPRRWRGHQPAGQPDLLQAGRRGNEVPPRKRVRDLLRAERLDHGLQG